MNRATYTIAIGFLLALSGCSDHEVTAPDAARLSAIKAGSPAEGDVLLVTPALHDGTLPTTLEGLVCGMIADLDDLLAEFDLAGNFDDDRLNQALDKAYDRVVQTRAAASEPDLNRAFREWRAAMRELEKGASVPVSGNGFADDLASLGSFYAEVVTGDLIALAAQLGAASPAEIEDASQSFQDGMAARDASEWEQSLRDFGRAVHILSRSLDIGPPCA